jgi:hypothetical protein
MTHAELLERIGFLFGLSCVVRTLGRFQCRRIARILRFAQDDKGFYGYNLSLLLHICVEDTVLLKVVGHGVLRQKRCLEADFGANPLALRVGSFGRMVAASAAAELGAEIRALNLIELANLAPRGVANRPRDINLQL